MAVSFSSFFASLLLNLLYHANHYSCHALFYSVESPVCSHEGEDSKVVLTLEDVLTFVTGANCIPPMGFDTPPQTTFCHDNSHYPTASTCSINKDSLFIERCFIILHANDRSNSWNSWIWQSLTLLIFFFVHFPCKCRITLYVQCTVFIPEY